MRCLFFDAVPTVIPGMLTTSEAEENTQASTLGALEANDRSALLDAHRRGRFFVGE